MNRILAWMIVVMAVAVVASLIEVALLKPQPAKPAQVRGIVLL